MFWKLASLSASSPVPRQNQWTECSSNELKNRFLDLNCQNREKRPRVDEEMTDSMESNTLEAGIDDSPFKKMKAGESTSSASESQVPRTNGASIMFCFSTCGVAIRSMTLEPPEPMLHQQR